jgi:hypothetical protein
MNVRVAALAVPAPGGPALGVPALGSSALGIRTFRGLALGVLALGLLPVVVVPAAQARPTPGTIEIGVAGTFDHVREETPRRLIDERDRGDFGVSSGYFITPVLELGAEAQVSGTDGEKTRGSYGMIVVLNAPGTGTVPILPYAGVAWGRTFNQYPGGEAFVLAGFGGFKSYLSPSVALLTEFRYSRTDGPRYDDPDVLRYGLRGGLTLLLHR